MQRSTGRRRKAAAIVKLLALAPGHRLHCEQILDQLWPDLDPEAAANNLRHTLHVARRTLGPPPAPAAHHLTRQSGLIALCPAGALWVDVEAFEAAAAAARRTRDPADYAAALRLYTGDLLPEDRYEEWVAGRREALRRLYLALLEDLARLQEARGEHAGAIEALLRVVAGEPAHEDAHRGLMRLYALTGRRHQALRQYRQLGEALLRELDSAPGPASQALYQEILTGRFPADGPHLPTSSRDEEAPPVVSGAGKPGPPDRPTGTVTFLLTDVEGSTRLRERHSEGMKGAIADYDALLRQAIEAHNGWVFKTVGDGFCAAFATAADALGAALAAQRALSTEPRGGLNPLSVRMALHTGVAEQREGDYFGPPLNRVARLLSAGHGGQILLSRAAEELLRDQLPEGTYLYDLGEHRLRDQVRPERVYQVVSPDLPGDFPPLRSVAPLAGNLPVPLTSFIGREREIAEVNSLLAATRLLTLTGTGGVGKTRLALEVAGRLDGYPDGVWWVELAALADPGLLPQAVAAALALREEPGHGLLETLASHLCPKQALIVLDNCEHLVEACAQLADALLRACPNLRILATSREPLRVAGEVA